MNRQYTFEIEQSCDTCEHWVRIIRGDGLLIKDWHCDLNVLDDGVCECDKYEQLTTYDTGD